jgi:mono/diheme cytochrome c family protein
VKRAAVLAVPAVLAVAAGIASATPRHASYQVDQAKRGALEYIQNCGECHGGALGGNFGPALAGPASRTQFESGASVYSYMTAHMPNGNAGALPQDEYLDIMAFIYERNGIPSGPRPLTAKTIAADMVPIGK